MREVWITGVGILSSVGIGLDATWDSLLAGRTGAGPIDDESAEAVGCGVAARIVGFKARKHIENRKSLKLMTRPVSLGVAAAGMAYSDAGMSPETVDPERLGIFVGAGQAFADRNELQYALDHCRDGDDVDIVKFGAEGLPMIHPLWLLRGLSNNVLGFVSLEYQAQGINNNYANSGISGTQAILAGLDAIREGFADAAFAGGYDTQLSPECIVGYGRLGLLATGVTEHKPFDKERSGMVPSEGAGFLMLEAADHARARGAKPIARLSGGGVASDAFGVADPDPKGTKLKLAVKWALDSAELAATDLDAIFAHGAASERFDHVEAGVYRGLLGDRAQEVPITADKASVGHTAAAGGAITAGIAARALREQTVPAIATLTDIDPDCDGLRFVVGEPQSGDYEHVLVASAGLGGQAAALVVSRVEDGGQ
jgi:3-oxoacyl-[acyl-carrier-protein] synthase II